MNRLTALEIIGQRDDIAICLFGSQGDGYAFSISRGPGHRYKPLFMPNDAIAPDREGAIKALEENLRAALATWQEASGTESPIAGFLELNGSPMTEADIATIVAAFRNDADLQAVCTWELLAKADAPAERSR